MILTEHLIQRVIMRQRYRQSFCLPNYTPRGWWECDVFEVTKAGYFREYEIKLSLSDFKADKRKCRRVWHRGMVFKQDRLSAGADSGGPVQFYYVTPPGMLCPAPVLNCNPDATVPAWAGLMEVHSVNGWLRLEAVKRAPRLHQEKFAEKRLEHARTVPYYRMHDLLKTGSLVRELGGLTPNPIHGTIDAEMETA